VQAAGSKHEVTEEEVEEDDIDNLVFTVKEEINQVPPPPSPLCNTTNFPKPQNILTLLELSAGARRGWCGAETMIQTLRRL